MSDQPMEPLGRDAETCVRIEMAWSQVGEWKKIM